MNLDDLIMIPALFIVITEDYNFYSFICIDVSGKVWASLPSFGIVLLRLSGVFFSYRKLSGSSNKIP